MAKATASKGIGKVCSGSPGLKSPRIMSMADFSKIRTFDLAAFAESRKFTPYHVDERQKRTLDYDKLTRMAQTSQSGRIDYGRQTTPSTYGSDANVRINYTQALSASPASSLVYGNTSSASSYSGSVTNSYTDASKKTDYSKQ